MKLYEKFLEFDYNPFILFDKDGRVKSLNQEAQYLLGYVSSNEIYQLALSYANSSYGFKTTFVDLEYGKFKIFAICIGYENDDEIGIKLYRHPEIKIDQIIDTEAEFVNIYQLLDLCISAFSTKYRINFSKDIDPTLPEIKLNAQNFIALLNEVFEIFKDSAEINIKLHINIGESIKINSKKYLIFSIDVIGKKPHIQDLDTIKDLAKSINSYLEIKSNSVSINIPMITS